MSQRPWRPARGSAKAPPREHPLPPLVGWGCQTPAITPPTTNAIKKREEGDGLAGAQDRDRVEAWRAARLDLLKAEKQLTRLADDLARRRRELPWVRLGKDYCFDTEAGEVTMADLFQGRSQLSSSTI